MFSDASSQGLFSYQPNPENRLKLTITPTSFAYISENSDSTMYRCILDTKESGGLKDCQPLSGIDLNHPMGLMIQNANIYITNQSGGTGGLGYILSCDINTNNGQLNNCQTHSSSINIPIGIASYQGYAYVINQGDSTVSLCDIGYGPIKNCKTLYTLSSTPMSIGINDSYAYIAFQDGSIQYCEIEKNTGQFSNGCTDASQQTFASPFGIAAYSSYAYITNNVSPIPSYCALNTDGTFASCNPLDFNDDSYAIEILPTGYAYIGNGASIYQCTIQSSNGNWTSCTQTSNLFSETSGIAFY